MGHSMRSDGTTLKHTSRPRTLKLGVCVQSFDACAYAMYIPYDAIELSMMIFFFKLYTSTSLLRSSCLSGRLSVHHTILVGDYA
jgi:hypothetical protein